MILDNKEEFLLFLKLIKKKKNLGVFTILEYSYSDIVKTIEECEKNGYIRKCGYEYIVTPFGEKKVIELQNNKSKLIILPRKDKKIEKLGLFDIYVPDKK